MERKKCYFKIRFKVALMIAFFAMSLVVSAMGFYSMVSTSSDKKYFNNVSISLANTISEIIDVDKFLELKNEVKSIGDASEKKVYSSDWGSDDWNAYTAQFEHITEEPLYKEMVETIRKVDSSESLGAKSYYLSYIDKDLVAAVYVCDTDEENPCPPGCLDSLNKASMVLLDDPNTVIPPFESNLPNYGHLLTAGANIYKDDEVVGIAYVDISMDSVMKAHSESIWELFLYLSIATIIIVVIGVVISHFTLVAPMKKLNDAANSYDTDDFEKTHKNFTNLKINTRDEIEELSYSIKEMENDVYQRINELTRMNEALVASQAQTVKMTELANKDALTGVFNKVAYLNVVNQINEAINKDEKVKFALVMIDLNYLKFINDEFGHEAGDEALIKLCKVVKEVFNNSYVYRVGGDEFVVILRGADYNKASRLINLFNEKIGIFNMDDFSLDRVSAAVGYAIYDPSEDCSVDDVFRRADKAMYARKHEMKAKRE